MLAQPLNERDKGGQGITCAHLSPGLLLLDNDVSETQTGVCSAPPLPPSCASSSFSPSFFPATTSSPPCSSPSLNFFNSPCVPPSVFLPPPISVPPHTVPVCSFPQTSASSPPIISSALSSHLACISPSPPFYTSPPISLTLYPSPTFSSTTSLAPPSDSPLPPPAACSVSLPSTPVFFTSSSSFLTSPVSLCTPHTSAILPVSPFLHPQPNPPACCSCSSILPRLLTAHRLEMRRLLRRAMASLGRRLDLLERKSRKKRRRKRTSRKGGEGSAVFRSFCNPDLIPAVTSASSLSSSFLSLDRDLSRAPLSCCLSKPEQRSSCREHEEVREIRNCIDKAKEEENPGRFVGQMRVSVRGCEATEEEVVLTLHNFSHRRKKQDRDWPLQKAVIRQNGYSISDLSSQHALHHLQSAQRGLDSSQSDAFCVSVSQWHFSGFILPNSIFPSQTYFPLRLCSSFSGAPMLLISGVSVEMLLELWSRAFGSPLRPLRDRTAPPSLSSDHCYVRRPTLSITFSTWRQRRQRANTITQSFYLPQQQPLPLPSYLVNGLSAPFPADKSKSTPKFGSSNADCSKRVSQFRIRRATPREAPLTPMGLPKVKRLKKKEFSLEEIYTNKNYKSPTTNRSLETIFEEPREKDGALLLIGQQRRRRLLLFPDFTQPRKRKRPQGLGLSVAMGPRKRVARRHCQSDGSGDDDIDLDVMLVKRLSALEDFMTQQGLDV